jgi:hypothetical protein
MIMKLLLFILTITVFLFCNMKLTAQQQVPFDTLNNIQNITPEIEKEIGYFKMYSDFQKAELFLNPDSTYTLKVHYMSEGNLNTKDLNMSREEYLQLRSRVLNSLKFERDDENLNHRTRFLISSAALGGVIWVPSLLSLMDIENASTAGGLYFISLGGCYLIPGLITRNQNVSKSSAILSAGGGILGAGHGMLLFALTSDDLEGDLFSLLVLSGSFSEYLLGYNYAKNKNLTAGEASMMTSNGLIFGIHGFLLSAAADLFQDDGTAKLGYGLSLAGSIAGIYLGKSMANDGRYTSGDAGIYTNLTVLGAYAGASINALTEIESAQAGVSIVIATTAIGQLIGHSISDDYDFTDSQSNYAMLGTVGGGLIGAGLGLMTDNYKGVMALSSLGAIAGFSTVFLALDDDAKSIDISDNIDFEFNPSALMIYENIDFNPYLHRPAKLAGIKFRF